MRILPQSSPRLRSHRLRLLVVSLTLVAAGLALVPAAPVVAASLPTGFQENVAISGLSNPTSVRFAPDGRVFVAEKTGRIKVFDSLADTAPTVFADLRTNVYDFWDRGMLGLALDPDFATKPYVYVLYAYDAAIGDVAPRWGTPGVSSDPCPTPPGPTDDGCVVSGRLSRLEVGPGNVMTGSEQVLINDWCQQYPSHSIGSLEFGPDRSLYVSGGDGASFTFADYGQKGSPLNPCGDPPGGAGSVLTPPTAEGGALRSQDLRTAADPVGLDGAILRVNPDTGAAMPDNPLAARTDANARRIVAYGLRNPFRMTRRPGTNEIWVGDVGWDSWEELDVLGDGADGVVENFGWPCYEGPARQPAYDGADLNICEKLYAAPQGTVTAPYFAYPHSDKVVPSENCPVGGSSTAGVTFRFYENGNYPPEYDGALFFADYTRDCIWVMPKGPDSRPDTAQRQTFAATAANPVDLQIGPGGDLFYVDLDGGAVRRISYGPPPPPPPPTHDAYLSDLAWTSAVSGYGPVELDTNNGGPDAGDGGPITLNGVTYDKGLGVHAVSEIRYNLGGTCSAFHAQVGIDDSEGSNGSAGFIVHADGRRIYRSGVMTGSSATKTIDVSVADAQELSLTVNNGGDSISFDHADWADARVYCSAGTTNTAPVATIVSPAFTTTWKVGDTVSFSGGATDAEDGTLPPSALSWSLIMHHCPSTCHTHQVQTFAGTASGSVTTPDHDYPSYLELQLTATDYGGTSDTKSVLLYPQTVALSFATQPSALRLVVGSTEATAPFSRTVIIGSSNSVSAPTPQFLNNSEYAFDSWSDGGAQSHNIVAPEAPATYTAEYAQAVDATGPVISSVEVVRRWTDGATITWTTDEPADSQVEYGTTMAYGSVTPLGSAQVTAHTRRLRNLTAGTLYTFRVRSRDAAGNLSVSSNFTFRTKR